MTWLPGSIDSLQSAYDSSPLVTIAAGTPIALTTAGAAENGVTITDGADTLSLLGNGIVLPIGLVSALPVRFSSDLTTGAFSPGAGLVALVSQGEQVLSIGPHDDAASSGITDFLALEFDPTGQTSTAGWTAIKANVLATGGGSGTQRLLDVQVAGTSQLFIKASGSIRAGDTTSGSAADPVYGFGTTGADDQGFYCPGAGQVALSTAGTEIQFWDDQTPTSASGVHNFVTITGDGTGLTGTAGYNTLVVNMSADGAGSGDENLQQWQVGGTNRGRITSTGQLVMPTGSDTSPSYTFEGSLTTGFFLAGGFRITVSGNEYYQFSTGAFAPLVSGLDLGASTASFRWEVLYMAAGVVGAPAVAIGTDINGLYAPATDQIALSTEGGQIQLWEEQNPTQASGVHNFVTITGDGTGLTGTAGYKTFVVNMEVAGGGSGEELLQEWQIAGAKMAHISEVGDLVLDGTVLTLAEQDGANRVGLSRPATGQLALVAAGSNRITLTSASCLPVADSSMVLGAATLRYAQLHLGPGTAALPALSLGFGTTDSDNGFYASATDQIAMSLAGAVHWVWATSECVTRGNIRPNSDNTDSSGTFNRRWDRIFAAQGSAALPSVTVSFGTTDTDNGLFAAATDTISVAIAGTEEYVFKAASFEPFADNVNSLGASGKRFSDVWATTTTVGDLNLHSLVDGAKYTINENMDGIFLHDLITGKVYKFVTQEVDPSDAPAPYVRETA
jgi:hypothetical protein